MYIVFLSTLSGDIFCTVLINQMVFKRFLNFGARVLENYWVQRGFRLTRVGVLVLTVYNTGYRAGLSDFVADPDEMRRNLLTSVVYQAGATSLVDEQDPISKRLRRIAPRIVNAAKDYCEEQSKTKDVPVKDVEEWKEKWTGAVKRMQGEWKFVVIDSPVPNAFVSNILPQMIFVHKGLFTEIEPTDEELALILAHEVSHLIHDHTQFQSYFNLILVVAQLFALVFVDPTGTWFYVFDMSAARLSSFLSAAYSRDTETEADITGVQIAARACFETREAGKVFLKFADFKGHDGSTNSWNNTHPADKDREAYLREASKLHNPEAYNPSCHQVESYLDQFHKFVTKKERDAVRKKNPTPLELKSPPLKKETN